MAKRIVFDRDNVLRVIHPLPMPGESEQDMLARVEARNRAVGVIPEGVAVRVVEDTDLPADGPDREAWIDTGSAVQVDATRLANLNAARAAQFIARAKAVFDEPLNPVSKADRAIVVLSVDQFNDIRGWLMDFKAAVAAASSLANLKTLVAGLPSLPDLEVDQAKTAIRNHMDGGA